MKLLVLFPLLEKPPSKRNRVLNAAILAKISVKFRALLMFPYNSLMHTLSLFLVKVCVFTSMQRMSTGGSKNPDFEGRTAFKCSMKDNRLQA